MKMAPNFDPGFPGLIAPASLKRLIPLPPSRLKPRFSGVNRPGLIEASKHLESHCRT